MSIKTHICAKVDNGTLVRAVAVYQGTVPGLWTRKSATEKFQRKLYALDEPQLQILQSSWYWAGRHTEHRGDTALGPQ